MTPSLETRAKRHYLGANVAPSREGFTVELDGRCVKTPGARRLIFPTEALAEIIAGEWNAQEDVVDFETMPATRLARAAVDALPDVRDDLVRRVVEYAGDDLLCYFADAPLELVRRQQASWEPILAWAEAELGQSIRRSSGVVQQDQTSELLAAVQGKTMALADLELAALTSATQLFGSGFLALALQANRLDGEGAFAASRIDETFQAETWGEDAASAGRAFAIKVEAHMLERWFAALA